MENNARFNRKMREVIATSFSREGVIQMLPQKMKEEIMPSIDNFPRLSKEENEKLIEEITKQIDSRWRG